MNHVKTLPIILLIVFMHQFCTSLDTITINQPIVDGDVIVSTGETFALGFFSPVVWVANRDSPINDTSGVVSITCHVNVVLNSRNKTTPLWFTNVSALPTNNCVAQLLDSGNLVLFHSGSTIWQSFEHPTNYLLPKAKFGLDRRKGLNSFLTSWKSSDDPGTGNFSFRINPEGYPQLFIYKGHVPKWRGGHWNGVRWSGIPKMQGVTFIFNYSYVNNENEISFSWNVVYGSILTIGVLNESGIYQRSKWHENLGRWEEFASVPRDHCDIYGLCGAYGNCVRYNDEINCTCLPGYQPKSPQQWHRKDGSVGCVRKNQTAPCRNGEGFVEVANVKAPDTSVARVSANLDMKACKNECLRNCSCTAYASLGTTEGSGCLTWYGDLLDTRVFTEGGQSIYVRVDAIELAQYENKRKDLLARKGILLHSFHIGPLNLKRIKATRG
ncbi:G-type lectin S-receptor-like serine/threonine-protein kinase RKS1 [Hevea brasiliensis]|uniref:G-type lectin S-receptor-like serine/threonine-protein kinase RKS1 n=1 Tax=Hevea brasiliensis TaxID=3981 RepID=UPI0025EB6DB6|nr:G-type lectin S-receptor-like serine/threonine-protein kinase RKS1 [Hevea brasiliensis]